LFLELDELGEVGFVERVGLPHAAAGVELVVPDFAGFKTFLEEEDDRFDACALEGAAGAVEDGVEVAGFEEKFAKGDGGVVGVGEEGVFDDDAGAAAGPVSAATAES